MHKQNKYCKIGGLLMKKRILAWICSLLVCFGMLPSPAFGVGEAINLSAGKYGEGLIVYASKNKKYGYADIFGNVVIKPTYLSANVFHNGLALVQVSGGKYTKDQFINTSGKVVVKAPNKTKTRYYGLCDYWDVDYAAVEIWSVSKKDGSITPVGYNYINEKGKLFNDSEYQYVGAFQEGFALVGVGTSFKKLTRTSMGNDHWLGYFEGNSSIRAASDYYYIDKNGQQLGNLTWNMGRAFSGGMAAVALKAGDSLHWGFIDNTGALRVTPEYSSVGDFCNGLAWVSDGEKYGYIDTTGTLVIPMTWSAAENFDATGCAVVTDGYYARLIDQTGGIVLDTNYSKMRIVEGTDRLMIYDGFSWGLADRTGRILVSPAYQYAGVVAGTFYGTRYDNILMICNEFGDLITPVILNGELISAEEAAAYPDGTPCKKIPFTADTGKASLDLCMFTDEKNNTLSINMVDNMRGETFTLQHSNGKTVLFDLDGNPIGTGEWDGFSSVTNENVICIKKGDFYGFLDAKTGEILQTPQYTSVTVSSDGIYIAMMGDNASYLDSRARPILPTITGKSGKDEIKALQEYLAELGYYTGKVNGGFNKALTEAVKKAQEALNLEPTGIADSEFRYAIGK